MKTPEEINERRRERARERKVEKVLRKMQDGRYLIHFFADRPLWATSDGIQVPEEIALHVIADRHVHPAGDALLSECRSQTYRFA